MPPKAWGLKEREGWNDLREHADWKHCHQKTYRVKWNWCLRYMIYMCGMGAAIHNRVYNNLDPRHGRSHPVRTDKRDSSMDASIQWVSHVTNHDNPQNPQPGFQQTKSRVLRSISTRKKYKFKHANKWAEVEHARTSSDYQPMMKAVNRRERYHQWWQWPSRYYRYNLWYAN